MKKAGAPILTRIWTICALLAALPPAGCGSGVEQTADKLEIVAGGDQMGEPFEALLDPLTVRVVGPRAVDFLGRRHSRQPVAGIPVTFTVEKGKASTERPASGDAPASDATAPPRPDERPEDIVCADSYPAYPVLLAAAAAPEPPKAFERYTVLTDASGLARANVRLGGRNGDWRIEAAIPRKGERVRFRLVTGVRKEVPETESLVGAKVPIGIRLLRLDREKEPKSLRPRPDPDRRVHFQVVAGLPPGLEEAEIKEKDKQSRTDDDGLSQIEVTLGEKPGIYHVLAEIEPKAGEEPIRGILLSVVAMDWVLVALQLATGVLVFVIGVRLLGSGFLLVTSPYMHLPTGTWAQNRFKGYLGGLTAGAIFESSSLVSSHLMNLANGGLLTAAGALGLLLGANVGGTMLPQLLSLDIGVLAAPFLVAGTLLFLVPRRLGLGPWGWVLLGAGLVLTGWGVLERTTELVSLSRRFKSEVLFGELETASSFTVYASRFLAYLCLGWLAAFALRTSNLLVVLAMLLAASGILGPITAIPVIVGANLGSASMVFALSIRKRSEARRLALANLLVQSIAAAASIVASLVTVDHVPLFAHALDWLTPGDMVHAGTESGARHIAMAHTGYNLLAGALFLFVPRSLQSLVDRLMPPQRDTEDLKAHHLDRNLIAVPALALRQATEEVIYLTEVCRRTVAEAFDSFRYNDLDLADQVVRREELIAEIHRETAQYLVEVCEQYLASHDASRLETLQIAASSLLRIGELGERLRDLASRRIEEQIPAYPEVDRDIGEVYDLVMAQFANILGLLRQRDMKTEENAVKMVERITKYSSRIESQWRQRIEQAEAPASAAAMHLQVVMYQEAFNLLFRVAGHLAHIAHAMRILTPERF